MTEYGRIIALDYGDVRVGVAVSDEMRIIATGVSILPAVPRDRLLDELKSLSEHHRASAIVVGLPLRMDGTRGERAELTEEFITLLKAKVESPVLSFDERLTTAQAVKITRELGKPMKKAKKIIDALSAEILLQSFLDAGCPGLAG